VKKLIENGVEFNLIIEAINRVIARIYATPNIEDLDSFAMKILENEILPDILKYRKLIPLKYITSFVEKVHRRIVEGYPDDEWIINMGITKELYVKSWVQTAERIFGVVFVAK